MQIYIRDVLLSVKCIIHLKSTNSEFEFYQFETGLCLSH